MPLRLYMDVHIPKAITNGLRLRGVDVLTTQEDGTTTLRDDELLDRATELARILFTFDDDLLGEAHDRQSEGTPFSGVVYASISNLTIGNCIRDLELVCKALDPADIVNRVEFLPL
ncbi:MAG: DUF5615 family PIN-like protein [Chloroflexia bacterium]